MMRRSVLIVMMICAVLICGCRNKRSVSEMSDEEKVAFEASEESKLTADERAAQTAVRKAMLDRMGRTKSGVAALEEAMEQARKTLDAEAYAKLDAVQKSWNVQGRGRDINKLVSTGVPAADAYAMALNKRAEWIQTRVSWSMLVDSHEALSGLYRNVDDRMVELYDMGEGRRNLVLRYHEDEFIFTASGKVEGDRGELSSDFDILAVVKVVRLSSGGIRIEPGEHFSESSFGRMMALVEGDYEPVDSGEFDVFSH